LIAGVDVGLTDRSDRTLSAVLYDIVGNVQEIIRAEVRLAKTEVKAEAAKASAAGLMLGFGALMLAFSLLFVLVAIVYGLSLVMPVWAAALIVAVVTGLLAAIFVRIGLKRFRTVRAAPKTVESVKENVEWARQQIR
jgi:uncharacterized membrane protein YqjE